jgi:hypothetical protein
VKALEDATKSLGLGQLVPDREHWKLKNFNNRKLSFLELWPVGTNDFVALRNYQVTGISYMISRECSDERPAGGFLADDMVILMQVFSLDND